MSAKSVCRQLALVLLTASSLTACGADTPIPPSPGVKLVANATASGLPTIAEFGATTCASCREMKIVLDSVARNMAGKAHVLVIDVSKDYEAAQAFRIQMIPTQIFFDARGKEVGRHMGKLSETEVITRLGLATP